MTRRRVTAFVDALLGNRRPPDFPASSDDEAAMRGAIEMRGAQPGAGLSRPEFVADLHRSLSAELDEGSSTPVAPALGPGARSLSRRGVIGGVAAAAAAAVAGAVIDDRFIASGGVAVPTTQTLTPDDASWQAVTPATAVRGGAVPVRFTRSGVAGFVSRTASGQVRGVSGVCTHQGCLLALDPSGTALDCPCHRASFALDGGVIHHELSSPLAPLPHLQVRERDGQIEVLLPPPANG